MSVREEVAYLKRVPLFSNVDENHLNVLAFAATDRRLRAGELLYRAGEDADAAFLLMEGEVEIFITEDDREVPVGAAGANDFLGERAMLCGREYASNARAVTDAKALAITREMFFRSVAEFPEMGVHMMRVLSAQLDITLSDFVELGPQLNTGVTVEDLKKLDQK